MPTSIRPVAESEAAMLLEELLSLPVGTRVLGEIERPVTIAGVVASLGDGTHLIRWEDGYCSTPLGNVRKYDEYIAAHTQLQASDSPRGNAANNLNKGQEVCGPETPPE
jgi:hypothetical protein